MKKIIYILCALGLLFNSCKKDDFDKENSGVKATFSNAVITRSVDEQWQTSDEIGIFMVNEGGDVVDYSNVPYKTATSGSTATFSPSSSETIYYANGDSKVGFWVYSPYVEDLIDNTYVVDISKNQDSPELIDLLWSESAIEHSKDNADVELTFKHLLSKLTLNLIAGDESTATRLKSGASISINGVATIASYNIMEQTLSVGAQNTTSIATREVSAGERYDVILIPDSDVDLEAIITIDGVDHSWKLDNFDSTSGMEHSYDLTITEDKITVTNSSIDGWDSGEEGELSADKALFSGGSGTEDDPYKISNAGDLIELSDLVNNENTTFNQEYFLMTNDIDLKGDDENQWIPIGGKTIENTQYESKFSGIFDGNNKSISGLYINNDSDESFRYVGFIGELGYCGVVKNLTINGSINVNASVYYIGGIVGYAIENTTIHNCVNNINITSNDGYQGGICGFSDKSLISNSINNGDLITNCYCGGITYSIRSNSTIINCYNTGSVSSSGGYEVGGISARFNSSIESSATSDISPRIVNCYNTGEISGGSQSGGVVGASNALLNCNYNIANIYASSNWAYGPGGVASTVESNNDTYIAKSINCFFSSDNFDGPAIDNRSYPATPTYDKEEILNTVGLSNNFMLSEDFAHILNHAAALYNQTSPQYYACGWEYNSSQPYPIHNVDKEPELYKFKGDGTLESPYTLSSRSDLRILSGVVNCGTSYEGAHFELTKDIALGGSESDPWYPIGTEDCPFAGSIDGNGYSITGLHIIGEVENQGLIGYHAKGGFVTNLSLEGSITSSGYNTGAIAGTTESEIINCVSNVDINGTGENVGGIAGKTINSKIINCHNMLNVNGGTNVGGIVGYSDWSLISNCYSELEVQGGVNVGGVVGRSGYIISNCFFNNSNFTGEVCGLNEYSIYTSEGKSNNETMSEEFRLLLDQKAYDYNQSNPTLRACGWKMSSDSGRPTLDYESDPAPHSNESGSVTNPYTISSLAELIALREDTENDLVEEGTHYKLTTDIDLNGSEGNQWIPIGSEQRPFWGILDANDKTISGLYINNSSSNQALFGYIGIGGGVKNLTLKGSVTSTGNSIGGVVAYLCKDTKIDNCTNMADVTGNQFVGGVCSYAVGGDITNCSNSGTINIGSMGGGVIGFFLALEYVGDIIYKCHNSGKINCGSSSGGVAGIVFRADMSKCYNYGHIKGSQIAGVVYSYQTEFALSECYNTGTIEGNDTGIGGVVTQQPSSIINCYNTGRIICEHSDTEYSGIGGISASANKISNCYNSAEIETDQKVYIGSITGIFQQEQDPTNGMNYCYAIEGTSKYGYGTLFPPDDANDFNEAAIFITEEKLKSSEMINELNSGLDTPVWKKDDSNINNGYPIFIWQ